MTSLSILRDPKRTSLRQLAYAYSHSKVGSDQERAIGNLLLARVLREIQGSRAQRRRVRKISQQLRFLDAYL